MLKKGQPEGCGPNWANQTIWTGDNLPIMRGMNSASVDLIYLDPPFNSNHNYAAPVGSKAAGAAFKDTWTLRDVDVEWINLIEAKHPALYRVLLAAMTDSDKGYLVYMAARLLEMKRLLKASGSIYLHCDTTMGHYLKLLMDSMFGRASFRNDVAWCYRRMSDKRLKRFARCHDMILFYAMSKEAAFNADAVRDAYSESSRARAGYRKTSVGRIGPASGVCELNDRGRFPDDWWEIPILRPNAKERLGYPTQKPLALLDRIIKASSNPGDVVFDPFCGCATALVAADRLQREWVGIDISSKAADLVKERLRDDAPSGPEDQTEKLLFNIVHRTDIPQRTDLGRIPRYDDARNKRYLYGEQGGYCQGCKEHFRSQNLEIDHIVPRSKGGPDYIENLQLLCGHCNRVKGGRGMEYLRVKLQIAA